MEDKIHFRYERTCLILGQICNKTIVEIMRFLAEASDKEEYQDEPLSLMVASQGGEVLPGLALIEFINGMLKPKGLTIHTYSLGYCESMAIPVFLSGDKRFISPNTTMFFHENLMSNTDIKLSKVEQINQAMERDNHMYSKIVNHATDGKIDREMLEEWMLEEKTLLPEQILDYGLAHEILPGP